MLDLNKKLDDLNEEVVKENNYFIDEYNNKFQIKILDIYHSFNIPFQQNIIDELVKEYFLYKIKDINIELGKCYKKMLNKYFDIINEYYHTNNSERDKIKYVTKKFIREIIKKKNPLLDEKIGNELIEGFKFKSYVYDNNELLINLEKYMKESIGYICMAIQDNYKEYIIKSMKKIIVYILSK